VVEVVLIGLEKNKSRPLEKTPEAGIYFAGLRPRAWADAAPPVICWRAALARQHVRAQWVGATCTLCMVRGAL